MKKTLISLAAASLVASSAFAADKGIDIVVGGQAAVYYQTLDVDGDKDGLLDEDNSAANVGIQLNLGADLGNNFTFGSQLTYLGTAGLEKNLVRGTVQTADATATQGGSTTSEIALTKLFIAKQIANTTVKIGRQELPMSLSPLAYSEGWNVYKNTFDAIVVINADIPKTTLVAAYVAGGTDVATLGTAGNLVGTTALGSTEVMGTAYMLTASTTAIPMATVTGSYYHLSKVAESLTLNAAGAALANSITAPDTFKDGDPLGTANSINVDAYWLDVAIADKSFPMGLNIGLQAAHLDPDDIKDIAGTGVDVDLDDTTMYGVKVGLSPVEALTLGLAYNHVDDGAVSVLNTGTGSETALFTNIVANERAVALDASTWMLNASYNTGAYGTIGMAYADSSADDNNLNGDNNDMAEFDLTYSASAGGVDYLVAYVNQDYDADDSDTDIIRIVARYNF